MKPPWVADEGLKYFPTLSSIQPIGKTYIVGQYSSELLGAIPSGITLEASQLTNPINNKFEFRNLIITDLATAHSIFWKKQNSLLRNFATNSLTIPVNLNWLQMNWSLGFSSYESNGMESWRWNIGDRVGALGVIEILNRSAETRFGRLSFSLEDNFTETPTYQFALNGISLDASHKSNELFFELCLQPGSNTFEISITNQIRRNSEIDPRLLNYRLLNLVLLGDLSSSGENDFWMRWKLHENGYESVQEISQSGKITLADGFYNEPKELGLSTSQVVTDRITWYLAKAFRE